MADFVKLNGYNVKDQTARNTLEQVTSDISDITEELENIQAIKDKILLHRGYSKHSQRFARDNSNIAFNLVGAYGLGGAEVDLRKDANGVIVCLHDENVNSVSSSSGSITTLAYQNVFYASKYDSGNVSIFSLCTLQEAIYIAKSYNMFLLFDMGKNVVTVEEVVTLCESLNFKNYGFFNVATISQLALAPAYALKVCGNDIFTHTEEELLNYIEQLGTNENVAIRLLANTITAEQVNLAKENNFKIIINYTDRINEIDKSYYNDIDFFLGEDIPYDEANAERETIVNLSTPITTLLDSLSYLFSGVLIDCRNGTVTELPTAENYMIIPFMPSINYKIIFAFNINNGHIYAKMKNGGTWYNWQSLSSINLRQ